MYNFKPTTDTFVSGNTSSGAGNASLSGNASSSAGAFSTVGVISDCPFSTSFLISSLYCHIWKTHGTSVSIPLTKNEFSNKSISYIKW